MAHTNYRTCVQLSWASLTIWDHKAFVKVLWSLQHQADLRVPSFENKSQLCLFNSQLIVGGPCATSGYCVSNCFSYFPLAVLRHH